MSIDTVRSALLEDTKAFLESNAVLIYGSNKSASGEKKFVIQATDDTGWKSNVGGSGKDVPFYVIYDAKSYNAKATGPQSAPIDVHYVSMRERGVDGWEDAEMTHYALPSTGASVMVTSKINGCTFGIGSNAQGSRLVSHLKPPGSGGAKERLLLESGTRAGFAGGKLDVSVMSSGEQNGTVIGIRTGSNWTFYAQRFQMFSTARGTIGSVQVYK